MKKLKSKILIVLMLGGLMGGMSSFSTVRIVAQDTASGVWGDYNRSTATIPETYRNVESVVYYKGFAYIFIGQQVTAGDYPVNALD